MVSTQNGAFERTAQTINEAMAARVPTVVGALPGTGKSRNAIEWAAKTGEQLAVLAHRHENRDQICEWAEQFGLTHQRVPTVYHDCPVAGNKSAPEHEELKEKFTEQSKMGVDAVKLHEEAHQYFGTELPCMEDGPCEFVKKNREYDETADVIVGHYLHGFNQDIIEDRHVVIDEFPQDYYQNFSGDSVQEAISDYLKRTDAPFTSFDDALLSGRVGETTDAYNEWRECVGDDFDGWALGKRRPSFRDLPPLFTRLLLEGQRLENGWWHLRAGRVRLAKSPETWKTYVLCPPDFTSAKSVIALDGTPNLTQWKLILGPDTEIKRPLTDTEAGTYLRDIRGMRIIQTTSNTKPYLGENGTSVPSDIAILEEIGRREGRKPVLITSGTALEKYPTEVVKQLAEETEYYGNLLGSNKFSNVTLGAVIGSHQLGDTHFEMWGAFAGHNVERRCDSEGNELKGTSLDLGRVGNALLESTREGEVLQAVLRFGRQPDKDGLENCTVYVHTAALPDWVITEQLHADIRPWSDENDGMNQVRRAINNLDTGKAEEYTVKEIASAVGQMEEGIGKAQVRNNLNDLAEWGYLSRRQGPGRGSPYLYSDIHLDELGEFGRVVLPESGLKCDAGLTETTKSAGD